MRIHYEVPAGFEFLIVPDQREARRLAKENAGSHQDPWFFECEGERTLFRHTFRLKNGRYRWVKT